MDGALEYALPSAYHGRHEGRITRSHEETEETVESPAHRSRCFGMIALALSALIAIKGLLV